MNGILSFLYNKYKVLTVFVFLVTRKHLLKSLTRSLSPSFPGRSPGVALCGVPPTHPICEFNRLLPEHRDKRYPLADGDREPQERAGPRADVAALAGGVSRAGAAAGRARAARAAGGRAAGRAAGQGAGARREGPGRELARAVRGQGALLGTVACCFLIRVWM